MRCQSYHRPQLLLWLGYDRIDTVNAYGTGPSSPAPPGSAPAPVHPIWQQQLPARPGRAWGAAAGNALLIVAAAVAMLLVGAFLLVSLGPSAFLVCGVLALAPLGICLLGLHWVDRWEPEPRAALLFAFLWGAGASVAITLLLGSAVSDVLAAALPSASADVLGTVLQAPLVEEFAKGLGVLILVFTRRSHYDGPVDGIVYAGTVAAGFAFTENILYFGSAFLEAGGVGLQLGMVFVLRGLFSPFAHVMFTLCIGIGVGLGARAGGTGRILLGFAAGLLPAVVGHMFWNGGIALVYNDFFVFYFLLQVPLFVAVLVGVVLLRRAEGRQIARRLGEYAQAGWFTAEEVAMLSTHAGRRRALSWASRVGVRPAMKRFIRDSARLAMVRQRICAGSGTERNLHAQQELLGTLTRTRGAMLARAGA